MSELQVSSTVENYMFIYTLWTEKRCEKRNADVSEVLRMQRAE